MHSDERRKAIADVLRAADAPVSASALAEKFSVSRQIIVGDIALLRSSGEEILATPRGYVTPKEARGILRRAVCRLLAIFVHSRPPPLFSLWQSIKKRGGFFKQVQRALTKIARKFIVTSQKRQEIPAFFRFTAKSAEFVFPPAPPRPSG